MGIKVNPLCPRAKLLVWVFCKVSLRFFYGEVYLGLVGAKA